MKQQHTLQPKLRFPEFEGDWKLYRLENLFEQFKSGNTITSKSIFDEGNYPVFGGNGLRGYSDKYTHEGKFFLIGRQGALCGNINRFEGKAFVSEHAIVCISNRDNNTDFLSQRLDYLNLNRLSESSAQPGLAVNKLLRLKLVVPSLPEQQKIADYLSTVDNKINLLEEKKAQLALYRKAMMQKLFSQEIRFKDDNGNDFPEWEEKRLGEIAKKMQSGGTPKASNRDYYIDGTIPFLSISDITEQGKYLTYAKKTINKQGIENSSSWIVPINSLIYSMYASVGFVTINKIEIATSQAVMNIILKEIGSLEYIYYYLSYFKKFINRFIETGTQGNINAEIVKNIKLPYPSLPEQQKIADFLSAIDESIKKVNEQINQTQSFKKAMLQQLFV